MSEYCEDVVLCITLWTRRIKAFISRALKVNDWNESFIWMLSFSNHNWLKYVIVNVNRFFCKFVKRSRAKSLMFHETHNNNIRNISTFVLFGSHLNGKPVLKYSDAQVFSLYAINVIASFNNRVCWKYWMIRRFFLGFAIWKKIQQQKAVTF